MEQVEVIVSMNTPVADGIFAMTFITPKIVEGIKGGQFVNLSVGDNKHLLKRPFGIISHDKNSVTIGYKVVGEGTKLLSKAKTGDKLSALLPLGNGFDLYGAENVAVIGGGVGVFPLFSVVEQYKNKRFFSFLGFRNSSQMCFTSAFKSGELTIVTDDGSYGKKGNAVEAFFEDMPSVDAIIACGPPIMLKSLKAKLLEKGIKTPCFVSLEERMACGMGACLVCTCKKSDGNNARVCKDGPVFDIWEVEL